MEQKTVDNISKEIRKRRLEKNMTLKELSEKTNLSVSFLSQVERGISSMTIVSLKSIANALDVSLRDLVDVDDKTSFVNKKDNQILLRLEKSFISYIRLSGKFENRKLEGVLVTMKPNFYESEETSHEGEEFYYVLKGSAVFIVDGAEYIISEGETMHYPSTLPHKTINPEDQELVMLSIITPTIF
ncbi:MAG TPA: XRE family transcriptional regulator [Clostridia bacterium]|nr:XRE family transcriptional regulator [Clostridia bacterium]